MLPLTSLALASLAYVSDGFPGIDRVANVMDVGVRRSTRKSFVIEHTGSGQVEGAANRASTSDHESLPVQREHSNTRLRQADPSSMLSGAGRHFNVAVLFRGESFRALAKGAPGDEHFGAKRRRTCEDDSFSHQKDLAVLHKYVIDALIRVGINVDVFGASYACQNGQDYADQLPEMYGSHMKGFDLIPKNGSSQLHGMAHVLRMALKSGKNYDGFYILRWDSDYWLQGRGFSQMQKAECFVDRLPRIWTYFEGGRDTFSKGDAMIYVPGPFAEQMLVFMEQDSSPCCLGKDPHNGKNRHGRCAQSCVWCAREFLMSMNQRPPSQSGGVCSPCVGHCGAALPGSLGERQNSDEPIESFNVDDFTGFKIYNVDELIHEGESETLGESVDTDDTIDEESSRCR